MSECAALFLEPTMLLLGDSYGELLRGGVCVRKKPLPGAVGRGFKDDRKSSRLIKRPAGGQSGKDGDLRLGREHAQNDRENHSIRRFIARISRSSRGTRFLAARTGVAPYSQEQEPSATKVVAVAVKESGWLKPCAAKEMLAPSGLVSLKGFRGRSSKRRNRHNTLSRTICCRKPGSDWSSTQPLASVMFLELHLLCHRLAVFVA